VYRVTDEALDGFKAELLLVYHAPPPVSVQRFANPSDYFQHKPLDYLERAAAGYDEAARHGHAPRIDATRAIAQVHEAAMAYIQPLL
jgi:thymidylate kinase